MEQSFLSWVFTIADIQIMLSNVPRYFSETMCNLYFSGEGTTVSFISHVFKETIYALFFSISEIDFRCTMELMWVRKKLRGT